MKRIIIAIAVIAQVLLTGAAFAAPVAVDFSGVSGSHDITISTNPAGYDVNGVFFRYDSFGSISDYATVDSTGVHGTTGGALIFDFTEPITMLDFSFKLTNFNSDPTLPLWLSLTLGSNPVADLEATSYTYDDLADTLFGTFLYSGGVFDRASMYFDFNATSFLVDNISYETASSVPLPGAVWLLGAGLFGVVGRRRRAQRKVVQA